ncbi:MAG: LytTR family DNA-binding domain-containing protein [bacterium]|nr:LytTR family DNA-binding domain-containing protein [bacterium]
MYQIALCDDETADLHKTEQMLDAYRNQHPEISFKTTCFETADALLCQIREKGYAPDLIFLDIYLPQKLGTDAARELRDMGNKGKIIFVTTSKEHALDAWGLEAAHYLIKPLTEELLFPTLDRFLTDTEEARKKYVLLRIDGKIRRIAVNEIVCCEAQGKTQYLHFTDGTCSQLRITMTELYEMLAPCHEFARVGISYIVNLEHVESLSRQELQMDNGIKIYPPRGSYPLLRERYFSYYCDEEN